MAEHLPTENSGECSACFQSWPCDVATAWERAHDIFCPRGEFCSTHLRLGDRYEHQRLNPPVSPGSDGAA